MKILFSFIISVMLSLPAYAKEISGRVPDFTLSNVQGGNVRLAELRGQVVMLNFWATWCGPCRQEMPELEKLYKRYSKAGFTILAINTEDGTNPGKRKEVKTFVDNTKLTFPILFDNNKEVVTKMEKDFLKKNMGMPTTVLVDRNGNARFLHEAYKPGDEKKYKKMVKALLRE